jgi:hypothetical protein
MEMPQIVVGFPSVYYVKRHITLRRSKVMETKPTHEQAQLHLQVYDLRREARLRQAGDWFNAN